MADEVGEHYGKKKGKISKGKNSGKQEKQRLKELEAAIRSQVAAEERAHKIVERLVLDEKITEEFLISAGNFIMPSHYADVTEERSLSHRCGYPICNNELSKIPSQKYTISTKTNRVYDITERKCFCSNFCYKASKYFESQLLTSPVWTRSCSSPQTFVLPRSNALSSRYQDLCATVCRRKLGFERCQLRGVRTVKFYWHGAGDLLLGGNSDQLLEKPPSSKVEDLCSLNNDSGSYGNDVSFDEDRNIVAQNSQSAKDQITFTHNDDKYLNKEKENHVVYSRDCSMTVSNPSSSLLSPSSTSSPSSLLTSSSPALASSSTTLSSSSTSLSTYSSSSSALSFFSSSSLLSASSISKHQGKSVQPTTASACFQIGKEEEVERGTCAQDTLVESVQKLFHDWCTPVTREYLGLFRKECSPNGCQGDKLESPVHNTRDTFDPGSFMDRAARWFRPTLNELDSGNKSSAGSTQDEIVVKEKDLSKGTVSTLPPIDSKSQNTIRRRIVLERLFQILPDLLSELKLTLGDVSRDLTGLVHTFSLSSQNVTLKPLQWKVAGLTLILVLQRKNALISQALESTTGNFNALLQRLRITQQELDSVVSEMILCEPLHPGFRNRGLPGDAASGKQEAGDDKPKPIDSKPEQPEDFGDMEELD